eukprot:5456107-Pleurochrysis_carterae.AAC.1
MLRLASPPLPSRAGLRLRLGEERGPPALLAQLCRRPCPSRSHRGGGRGRRPSRRQRRAMCCYLSRPALGASAGASR